MFHLAALHAPHVGVHSETAFRRANVDATAALLEAALAARVRRFVFASTTSVYGCTSRAVSEAVNWGSDPTRSRRECQLRTTAERAYVVHVHQAPCRRWGGRTQHEDRELLALYARVSSKTQAAACSDRGGSSVSWPNRRRTKPLATRVGVDIDLDSSDRRPGHLPTLAGTPCTEPSVQSAATQGGTLAASEVAPLWEVRPKARLRVRCEAARRRAPLLPSLREGRRLLGTSSLPSFTRLLGASRSARLAADPRAPVASAAPAAGPETTRWSGRRSRLLLRADPGLLQTKPTAKWSGPEVA